VIDFKRRLLVLLDGFVGILRHNDHHIDLAVAQHSARAFQISGHAFVDQLRADRACVFVDFHCQGALLFGDHEQRAHRARLVGVTQPEQEQDQKWAKHQSQDQPGLAQNFDNLFAQKRGCSYQELTHSSPPA